jgi:hypothetical protein
MILVLEIMILKRGSTPVSFYSYQGLVLCLFEYTFVVDTTSVYSNIHMN